MTLPHSSWLLMMGTLWLLSHLTAIIPTWKLGRPSGHVVSMWLSACMSAHHFSQEALFHTIAADEKQVVHTPLEK